MNGSLQMPQAANELVDFVGWKTKVAEMVGLEGEKDVTVEFRRSEGAFKKREINVIQPSLDIGELPAEYRGKHFDFLFVWQVFI